LYERFAKAFDYPKQLVELPFIGEDAEHAFRMNTGKRRSEKIVGRDGPMLADMLLEKGKKPKLLASQRMFLGERSEARLDDLVLQAHDAPQNLRERHGSIGEEGT